MYIVCLIVSASDPIDTPLTRAHQKQLEGEEGKGLATSYIIITELKCRHVISEIPYQ